MTIKHLTVYDFDDTLFRTPNPDSYKMAKLVLGKDRVPDITDISKEYMKWWDHPVSLDSDVFDIPAFEQVVRIYNRRDKETLSVLITRRDNALMPYIVKLLERFDIFMDVIHTTSMGEEKFPFLEGVIQKHPDLFNVIICEDSYHNILGYNKMLELYPKLIVNYALVSVPMLYVLDRNLKHVKGLEQRLTFKYR